MPVGEREDEMTRRMKRVGAIVVVAALGSAVFAVAGAAALEFHSETEPTKLTGEATNVHVFDFTSAGGALKCKQAKFEGTVAPKTTTEFKLSPTYSECTYAGVMATIKMNGCEYNFTTKKGTGEHYVVHIVCPEGMKVEMGIPALSCTLKFGAQTPEQGYGYTPSGSGAARDFVLDITLKNIKYERIGGALCQAVGNGTDLDYTGSATVRGYKDEKGLEGPQIGIWLE